jgi:hypothetical protein
MDYFVRMTQRRTFHKRDDEKMHSVVQAHYLPAFNKRDAITMASALNDAGHATFGNVVDRAFEVVVGIWSGKGRIYLDLLTLEQIADEYTSSEERAA